MSSSITEVENPMREAGLLYHELGFNVVSTYADKKHPRHKYTEQGWKQRKQTLEEVLALPWSGHKYDKSTGGVGVICGVGGLVVLDFDKADFEAVEAVLRALDIDSSTYPWVCASGSGTGYHVSLRVHEGLEVFFAGGKVDFVPKEGAPRFQQIELRWRDVITKFPPSPWKGKASEAVGTYTWKNGTPSLPPYERTAEELVLALESIGTMASAKVGSVKEEEPRVFPKTFSETLEYVDTETGELVKLEDLKEQERQDYTKAIRRFDLVSYIRKHFCKSTPHVQDYGTEWRVGLEGEGYGGWYVEKNGETWNTFKETKEGGSVLGGDCFELVGYKLFGLGYDKRNKEHFRAVLQEVSKETGVEFSRARTRKKAPAGVGSEETDKPSQGGGDSQAEKVQAYLSERFLFRWNTVRLRLEWTPKEEERWSDITNLTESSWRVNYEKDGNKRAGKVDFGDYITELAHQSRFDPFRTYFDGLPKHTEEADYIAELASLVSTPRPELFTEHLRKWLVATYACAYYDGASQQNRNRNEFFLVLAGKQGVGKTTFLRSLVPGELSSYRLEKCVKDTKDSEQLLAQSFLLQDDELTTHTKNEENSLKKLLSDAEYTFRPPYGKHPETFPRRVSFCGSTNATEFLKDTTGSRRFLVHEVTERIDFEAVRHFGIDKVWAQARHLYETGFKFWMSAEEQAETEAHNEGYAQVHLEEVLLLRYLRPAREGDVGSEFLQTSEVAMRIAELFDVHHTEQISGQRDGMPRFRADSMGVSYRLGMALAKHAFPRKSHRRASGAVKAWHVVVRPRNEWIENVKMW